ncbi:pepsin/retropepsin-like aspartic protease family protein [Luteolibacter marinus]|uniref:pepsin/retropepsin-like aspartic protease family protein n=1 Tax=Luteolibacter marinus TaxID=2776705 RepID=UPI0018666B09|nr:pepsin/retropepsin-like aspartic protease family protein [Luteolibacter marinus]
MNKLTITALALAGTLTTCPGLDLEEIPLTRTDGSHHYLVDARVEGRDLRLLVDSGAGMLLVLSEETTRSIGMTGEASGQAKGIGGDAGLKRFEVGGFQLGDRRFSQMTTYSVDLQHASLLLDGKLFPPEGLVGVRLLKRLNAVVDTRRRELLLPPRKAAPDAYLKSISDPTLQAIAMHEGAHGLAYVDIRLADETYAFLVDTGAGTNSLEPAVAEELGLVLGGPGRDIGGAGAAKVTGARRAEIRNPVIGGKVTLPVMSFDVHPLQGVVPPGEQRLGGILGSRTLGALGARVDFGSYRIFVPPVVQLGELKKIR